MVDAEIARLQAEREALSESLAIAEDHVEEVTTQLEKVLRVQKEEHRQFGLPRSNAARVPIKKHVCEVVLSELRETLKSLGSCEL